MKNMETIKLSSIKINPDNPRLIKDAAFKKLVQSVKRRPMFLEKRGIVVADGVILGGNQRYMAIKGALRDESFRLSLGLSNGEIPASWVQDASQWTEEERREFVIVDNGSFGEWNMDILANQWGDLQLPDFGVNLPEDWLKQPDEIDPPELKDGDRAPFIQMTFTLHDEQAEEINAAIKEAQKQGGGKSAVNENSNGNALAFICERFNRG